MSFVNVGIICGDGRDRLTEQCIRSFYAHTDLSLCDLTVLDNATSEGTKEMLVGKYIGHEKYVSGSHYVRYDEVLGGGSVTNRLLENARKNQGQFLYHTASDFYFKAGWLEALLTNWPLCEAMGVGLLGAYSHPYHLPAGFAVKGVGGYEIVPREMVAGGSWFMSWALWDTFGPLNEQHKGLWVGSEDTEFNQRLIAAGVGRATIRPEVVVHTGRTASNGMPTLGAEYMPDIPGVLIE